VRPVLVIAEAGVNHNGDLCLARRLVDAAARAGADMVKFQTFKTEQLVTRTARLAEYQKRNVRNARSQYAMLKRLELDADAHRQLMRRCAQRHITFLSTAFDSDSVDLLARLRLPYWKIPSGEITNVPLLRRIGAFQSRVILSTGMATLEEIERALNALVGAGTKLADVTVLHCTTAYPAPYSDVNLRAMLTLRDVFDVAIGYSDHTDGMEIAIAAVALGASVIEKHFTLDRTLPGPDHKTSLDPGQLRAMVAAIRHVERALGDGRKRPAPSERSNRRLARKSIVAARPIRAGEAFTARNLTVKRPGTGLSAAEWDRVIGRKARRAFLVDELIER